MSVISWWIRTLSVKAEGWRARCLERRRVCASSQSKYALILAESNTLEGSWRLQTTDALTREEGEAGKDHTVAGRLVSLDVRSQAGPRHPLCHPPVSVAAPHLGGKPLILQATCGLGTGGYRRAVWTP